MNQGSFKKRNPFVAQESALRYPLLDSSDVRRVQQDRDDRRGNVVNLANNQQQQRVTTINLNSYNPINRNRKQPRVSALDSPLQQELQELSPSNDRKKSISRSISRFSEHESFISTYQNNPIKGILVYLLFIVLLTLEVIVISYAVPSQQQQTSFPFQKIFITILLSQLFFYLILRYLNNKTSKKLIKHKSLAYSWKHIMYSRKKKQVSKSKVYMLLGVIGISLVVVEMIYAHLIRYSLHFGQQAEGKYKIASIFWAYYGMYLLMQGFYFNQMNYHNNASNKVQACLIVVLVFMCVCFIDSPWLFIMMALLLISLHISTKNGFEITHINYFIKGIILSLVVFAVIIEYLIGSQSYSPGTIISSFFSIILTSIIAAIAMVVTRIVAFQLKQSLYKYFYTQMHMQMGYIYASIALYACYLHQKDGIFGILSFSFVAIIFLVAIGWLVFAQGRQKLEVSIDVTEQIRQHS